jgi:hypothetical protein
MKRKYNFKSLVMLLLIVLSGSSCTEELEKSPLDQFDNATFWSSEENAMLALAAVYRGGIIVNGGNAPTDWWSWTGLSNLDLATDDAYHRQGENNAFHRLSNGTLTSNLAVLKQYWTPSYKRIARCNDFLENIARVPISEDKLNRLIAEARFIRAAQYFYLSQHFGSVPLVKKTLSPEEANTVSKAPRQEIVDFVIDEFAAAAADLPRYKDIPSSEIGRASKQAVLAFLGRIQLAEELFEDAANSYKTIIDFDDNIIDPDYRSIFLEANEDSKENIFSIQYIPNLLSNGIMQINAPRTMGGYTFINPLANLMESYQFTDGTPFSYTDPRYDYTDLGKNRDPRLKYTMYYNGGPFKDGKYVSHPDSAHSLESIINGALGTRTGYLMKKFIDESITGNFRSSNGGNTPIIRYAEVLLSYLEAKLEAGHNIDQSLLDATINQVRGRASVNMPPITETDPALLRPILRNERRVELALEGIRFWDLLRWKIADEVLNGDFYGHPYPVSEVAIRKKPGEPEDTYSRWYVTTRNFRKGVDEFWPIPQAEVNINPNLGE